MNPPISCLAAALVLGPVATAAAQDAPATLARYAGSQARFVWTTEPGAVKKGTLVRGDGTSITFAVPGEGEVTLPTTSVSRLDVYAGKKRHTWHGLVAGAAVGVGLGFAAKVDADGCNDSYTTACSRGEALATYGGVGTLVGALVGSLIQSDRWTPVVLPALRTSSVSTGRGSRMALRLGVTFRF
jgi:hypothetical protein